MRAIRLGVVALLLATPFTVADADEATVTYVDASGSAAVGLLGAGIDGVDLAAIPFVPNATHPKLQILLDYAPTNLTLGSDAPSVTLIYEFRLDVVDNASGMTVASFGFRQPGERHHTLDNTTLDGRTFRVDLYLRVGVDVDWQVRVVGWRGPIPL